MGLCFNPISNKNIYIEDLKGELYHCLKILHQERADEMAFALTEVSWDKSKRQ